MLGIWLWDPGKACLLPAFPKRSFRSSSVSMISLTLSDLFFAFGLNLKKRFLV